MQQKKIYPIELITFSYMALTTLFILLFWNTVKEGAALQLLLYRVAFAAVIGGLYWWNRYSQSLVVTALRQLLPLAFIIHFYPETFYFNNVIFSQYLDPVFIGIDQNLFGCQPSTEFSKAVSCAWFSELMHFAYMSYFFTIAGIVLYFFYRRNESAYRTAFILLCSFFVYYLIFIVLPVAGPQFYVFDHDNALPVQGPMRQLLLFFHSIGEQPTGAAPSSHCGIMLIYMLLLWRNERKLFWWILPLSVLLVLSTVYIRAHYVIDVLLGFATAPLIYLFSNWCWKKLK